MGVKHILDNFAEGTTMHGVPKAIKSRSSTARIFWASACLLAATMFCFQLSQLLTKYYSYPKKVTIEIVPAVVPFPAISLCNMRSLDSMVLNSLNRVFKQATDPLTWTNYTDDEFINEYMVNVAKYFPMYMNSNVSNPSHQRHVIRTLLSRTTIASNVDRSLVAQAGIPFKEFIVSCRFGGKDCNRTLGVDFFQFFDSYYYNCFTYLAPEPKVPGSSLAEGLENGWSSIVLTGSGMLDENEEIRIIPGTHDWYNPMSSTEGVRIVIHTPESQPFPHTEGFDVPPGHSVSLGVKATLNVRIEAPHGNCSNDNPFGNDTVSYRLISCQKKCLQKAIVETCGCKEISLPGQEMYVDMEYCSSDSKLSKECRLHPFPNCYKSLHEIYSKFECSKSTLNAMAQNSTAYIACGCFAPCREIGYDVSYSLAKWPAQASIEADEAYVDIMDDAKYLHRFAEDPKDAAKLELYAEYFDPTNRKRAMQDFARINVYISDSNVLRTEESEDYPSSQLLSDIGGQLGLWVGISIITLAEMLQLLLDHLKFLSTKHGPYSRGQNFSVEPEYAESRCRACNSQVQLNGSIPLTPVENDPSMLV